MQTKIGRPPGKTTTPIPVIAFNWCLIELTRDRKTPGVPRDSVRNACAILEKILLRDVHAIVPAATLRRHHREQEKMLKGMAAMGEPVSSDKMLAEARQRREISGWHTSPVALLGLS